MSTQRMKRHTGTVVFAAVLLLLTAFAASQVVAAGPVTNDTVAERIATAKTAADHEAIAAYYRTEAAATDAEVKRHEAMLAEYRQLSSETTRIMKGHCETLISSYQKAKAAYEGLAAEHEKLAKAAGGHQ